MVAVKVLGVLAGDDMPSVLAQRWCASADVIYAADGGADRVHRYGFVPNVLVGDMDSVSGLHPHSEWHHDPSQDSTDCDKLIRVVFERGHEELTLLGAEGNQLDHTLATLHSAAKAPIRVRLALRTGLGWILRSGEVLHVPTEPGRRVSLLPLTRSHGVTLHGVQWPLFEAELDATGISSISNRADDSSVTATVQSGAVFVFVGFSEESMPIWPNESNVQ